MEMKTGMARVCKQLYDEVSQFWGQIVRANVMDLQTLGELVSTEKAARPGVLPRRVGELGLTLRMPLEFFRAFERQGEDAGAMRQVQLWKKMPLTLANLPKLKALRIWLDHTDAQTWSIVNERAVLAPLLAHLSTTSAEVLIFLPMLHPIY